MSAYDPKRTSDASSTIESRLFMSGARHRILVFASNVFAAKRHTRWQQGLAIARSAAMDKLRCPLWVKSGHFDHKARYPLCPRKRTPNHAAVMPKHGLEIESGR
jgi:hypothetical protein